MGPGARRRDTALVGRGDVLAGLAVLAGDVASGHRRVALLSGEAGIGKTRLVTELLPHARALGLRVAIGHCDELDRSLPFEPVRQVLRKLAREPGPGPARRGPGADRVAARTRCRPARPAGRRGWAGARARPGLNPERTPRR